MSILTDINAVMDELGIQVETGVFTRNAPERYVTIIPMIDTFEIYADNKPLQDVQEVRLSIYTKGNYTALKNKIVRKLLGMEFTITDRYYVGYEEDTGYHHYNVDVANYYSMEE